MKCQIKRDADNKIVSVTDLNGDKSKLFDVLASSTTNAELALQHYVKAYTPEVQLKYMSKEAVSTANYIENHREDIKPMDLNKAIEEFSHIIEGAVYTTTKETLGISNNAEMIVNYKMSPDLVPSIDDLITLKNESEPKSWMRKVLDFLAKIGGFDERMRVKASVKKGVEELIKYESKVKPSELLEYSNSKDEAERGRYGEDSIEDTKEYKRTTKLGFPPSFSLSASLTPKKSKTKSATDDDIIKIEHARQIAKQLLGDNVRVSTAMDQVLDNLKETGAPAGMFFDGVIFLNENNLASSTVYHEAFHAVFRTMLTDEQRQALYKEVRKEKNYTKEEMDRLIDDLKDDYSGSRFDLDSLTREQLEELVLEEEMADLFENFKEGRKTSNNILSKLFDLLVDFINALTGKNRSAMNALFKKINRGGFKTKNKINEKSKFLTEIPMFKTIKTGEVIDTLGFRKETFATETQTNSIVSLIASKISDSVFNFENANDADLRDFTSIKSFTRDFVKELIEKETAGKVNILSPEEFKETLKEKKLVLKELQKLRKSVGDTKERHELAVQIEQAKEDIKAFKASQGARDKAFTNLAGSERFIPDLNIKHKDGTTNLDLIADAVHDKFRLLGTNLLKEDVEAQAEENSTADNREMLDNNADEIDPMTVMDKQLRAFLGLTTYKITDPNNPTAQIELAVNGNEVFFGILRFVHSQDLDTVEEMMEFISHYAENNVQAKAVYNRLLALYKIDNNHNILKLLRKNLNLDKIKSKMILIDPESGNVQVTDSAKEDEVQVQIKQAELNWYAYKLGEVYDTDYNSVQQVEEALDQIRFYRNIFSSIAKNSKAENQKIYNNLEKYVTLFYEGNVDNRSLEGLTGIDMSRGFIKMSLLYALTSNSKNAADINKRDQKFMEFVENNLEYEEGAKERTSKFMPLYSEETLNRIINEFTAIRYRANNDSPFIANYNDMAMPESKASQLLNNTAADAKNFNLPYHLKSMARVNALLDERVMSTSYQNASGKTIYRFVQKSYQISMNRWLKDPKFREQLKIQYPALAKLHFFSDPALEEAVFKAFDYYKTADLRQTNVDEYDAYGNRIRSRDKNIEYSADKDGVTSRDNSIEDLNIVNLVNFGYNRRKVGETTVAGYYTKTYETKSNDIAAMLPVGLPGNSKAFTSNEGRLTEEGYKAIRTILDTELEFLHLENEKMVQYMEEFINFLKTDDSNVLRGLYAEQQAITDSIQAYYNDADLRKQAYKNLKERGFKDIKQLDLNTEIDRMKQSEMDKLNNEFDAINDKVEKQLKANNFHMINGYHVFVKNGKIKGLGRVFDLWQMKNALKGNKAVNKVLDIYKERMELLIKKYNEGPLNAADAAKLKTLESNIATFRNRGFNEASENSIRESITNHFEEEKKQYINYLIDSGLFSRVPINPEIPEQGTQLLPTFNLKLPRIMGEEQQQQDGGVEMEEAPFDPMVPFDYGLSQDEMEQMSGEDPRDSKKWSKGSSLYSDFNHFLSDFYFNHFINVSNYNTIVDKDHRTRKNATDAVKRNGGSVAYGADLGAGEFKVAYIQNPVNLTKFGNEVEVADGQAYMSTQRFIFFNNRLGRIDDNLRKIFNKIELGMEISWNEKQAMEAANAAVNSVKGVFFNGESYHKLSYTILIPSMTSFIPDKDKKQAGTLRNIIMGINEDIENALKNKLGNAEVEKLRAKKKKYLTMYDALRMPIAGRETLHNLRRDMEFAGIDEVLPESASKIAHPVTKPPVDGVYDFSNTTISAENKHWKLQVETPSGKTKITYFSQVLHLIDNEQNHETLVNYNGKDVTIGQIVSEYRSTLADRVRYSLDEAFKELGIYGDTDKLISQEKLTAMLYRNLKASASNDTILNYVRESTLNLNLPAVREKFEQLFLTHFKNYLQPKVPGRKVSLVADYGFKIVVNRETGEIVNSRDLLSGQKTYMDEDGNLKPEYITRSLKWSQGTSTIFKLADGTELDYASSSQHRDNLVSTYFNQIKRTSTFAMLFPTGEVNGMYITEEVMRDLFDGMDLDNQMDILFELSEELGIPITDVLVSIFGPQTAPFENPSKKDKQQQSFAEVVMPHFNKDLFSKYQNKVLHPGTPEYDEVMTMFGARIPTQDKHSMIAFKIVDFLPPEMGDVGIFPKEIVELSGADFDIDSLYMIRREFYKHGNDLRTFGNTVKRLSQEELETTIEEYFIPNFSSMSADDKYKVLQSELGPAFYLSIRSIKATEEYYQEKEAEHYRKMLETAYGYFEYLIYMSKYNAEFKHRMKEKLEKNNKLKDLNQQIADEVRLLKIVSAEKREEAKALLEPYMAALNISDSRISRFDMSTVAKKIDGIKDAERKKLFTQLISEYAPVYKELGPLLEAGEKILKLKAAISAGNDNDTADALKDLADLGIDINSLATASNISTEFELAQALVEHIVKFKDVDITKYNKLKSVIKLLAVKDYNKVQTNQLKQLIDADNELFKNKELEDLQREYKELYDASDLGDNQAVNKIKDNIKKLREEVKEIKKNAQFEVLEDYNGPATLYSYGELLAYSYNEANGPNLKTLHNKIFDTNVLLYLNSSVRKISETAATMTILQGEKGNSRNAGLSNIMTFLEGSAGAEYNYNSILGQMVAKYNNREGNALVGPSAVANIVKATLARVFVQTNEELGMKQGEKFDLTAYNAEDIVFDVSYKDGKIDSVKLLVNNTEQSNKPIVFTTKNVRIMDEISSVLSAMTDNAKHTDAAKLSFNIDNLGTYLYLISGGVGLGNVALLAKQYVMQEKAEANKSKRMAIDTRTKDLVKIDALLREHPGEDGFETFIQAALEDAGLKKIDTFNEFFNGELAKIKSYNTSVLPHYVQVKLNSIEKQIAELEKLVPNRSMIADEGDVDNISKLLDYFTNNRINKDSLMEYLEHQNAGDIKVKGSWIKKSGGMSMEEVINDLQTLFNLDAEQVTSKIVMGPLVQMLTKTKTEVKSQLKKGFVNSTTDNEIKLLTLRNQKANELQKYNHYKNYYKERDYSYAKTVFDSFLKKELIESKYFNNLVNKVFKTVELEDADKINPRRVEDAINDLVLNVVMNHLQNELMTSPEGFSAMEFLAKAAERGVIDKQVTDNLNIVKKSLLEKLNTFPFNKITSALNEKNTMKLTSSLAPSNNSSTFPVALFYSTKYVKHLKEEASKLFGEEITKLEGVHIQKLLNTYKSSNPEKFNALLGFLEFQSFVGKFFDQATYGADKFTKVAGVIRLHQGIGSTFQDFQSKIEAAETLKLLEDEEPSPIVQHFSSEQLVDNSPDVKALLKGLMRIDKIASANILSRHVLVRNLMEELKKDFGDAVDYNNVQKYLEKSIIKLINYRLTRQSKLLNGISMDYDASIIYSDTDNIVSRFENTLAKAKAVGIDLEKNLFIKLLRKDENNSFSFNLPPNKKGEVESVKLKQHLLTINTRTNMSSEFQNRVTDAFRELMHDTTTDEDGNYFIQEFMNDLLGYALVKDGLTFANGSFLRVAPPELFEGLSSKYNSFMEEEGTAALGYSDFDSFYKEFVELLLNDPVFVKMDISKNIYQYVNKDSKNIDDKILLSLVDGKLEGFTYDGKAGIKGFKKGESALNETANPSYLRSAQKKTLALLKTNDIENITKEEFASLFLDPTDFSIMDKETVAKRIAAAHGAIAEKAFRDYEATLDWDMLSQIRKISKKYDNSFYATEGKFDAMLKQAEKTASKINNSVFGGQPIVTYKLIKKEKGIYRIEFYYPKSVKLQITSYVDGKRVTTPVTLVKSSEDRFKGGFVKYSIVKDPVSLGLNYTTDRNNLPTVLTAITNDFDANRRKVYEHQITTLEKGIKKAKEEMGKAYNKGLQAYDEKILQNLKNIIKSYDRLALEKDKLKYSYDGRATNDVMDSVESQMDAVISIIPGAVYEEDFDTIDSTSSFIPDSHKQELAEINLDEGMFKIDMRKTNKTSKVPSRTFMHYEGDNAYKVTVLKVRSMRDLLQAVSLRNPSVDPRELIRSSLFVNVSNAEMEVLEKLESSNETLENPLVVRIYTPVRKKAKNFKERFTNKLVVNNVADNSPTVNRITRGLDTNLKFIIDGESSSYKTVSTSNKAKLYEVSGIDTVFHFGKITPIKGIRYIDASSMQTQEFLESVDMFSKGSVAFEFGENFDVADAYGKITSFNKAEEVAGNTYPLSKQLMKMLDAYPEANNSLTGYLQSGTIAGSFVPDLELIKFINDNKLDLLEERREYAYDNTERLVNNRTKSALKAFSNNFVTDLSNKSHEDLLMEFQESAIVINLTGFTDRKAIGNNKDFASFKRKMQKEKVNTKVKNDSRYFTISKKETIQENAERLKDFLSLQNPNAKMVLLNSIGFQQKDGKLDPIHQPVIDFAQDVIDQAVENTNDDSDAMLNQLKDENIIC